MQMIDSILPECEGREFGSRETVEGSRANVDVDGRWRSKVEAKEEYQVTVSSVRTMGCREGKG